MTLMLADFEIKSGQLFRGNSWKINDTKGGVHEQDGGGGVCV